MNTAAFSGHLPNPVGSVAWYENDPQRGNALHFEGILEESWTPIVYEIMMMAVQDLQDLTVGEY